MPAELFACSGRVVFANLSPRVDSQFSRYDEHFDDRLVGSDGERRVGFRARGAAGDEAAGARPGQATWNFRSATACEQLPSAQLPSAPSLRHKADGASAEIHRATERRGVGTGQASGSKAAEGGGNLSVYQGGSGIGPRKSTAPKMATIPVELFSPVEGHDVVITCTSTVRAATIAFFGIDQPYFCE